ncbi:MAG: histidine phosphatase family protein [Acidobacteria bacterium]|nr:histidine phosphatase family protein [Acidobacteriota bacterium]
MKSLMRRLWACAALCLVFGSAATAYAPFKVTTVFLVRHAEKVSNATDAELSDIGHARAKRLATVLAKANIGAIYTSQFQRTKQTAAPLAQALALTPSEINVETVQNPAGGMTGSSLSPVTLKNYADKIAQNAGQTALIVGHSNSVPALITKLGVPQTVTIADSDYDNLFVVTIYAKGKAVLAQVKF